MDKELQLAINFKNAPEELKAAANAHYANIKALEKAKKKKADSEKDLSALEKAHGETAKVLRLALNAWNPEEA